MTPDNHPTDNEPRAIPEDEGPFEEESATPLSDRDRDLFLSLLDNPPPPNEALREAARRYRKGQN